MSKWNSDLLWQLAISAWLTSRFNAHHNYFSLAERDRTRFVLFTSIWTIVGSALYIFFFFYLPDSVFSSVASHILLYVDRSSHVLAILLTNSL